VEKYGRARLATDDNIIRAENMRYACRVAKTGIQTHTHTHTHIIKTYCFIIDSFRPIS